MKCLTRNTTALTISVLTTFFLSCGLSAKGLENPPSGASSQNIESAEEEAECASKTVTFPKTLDSRTFQGTLAKLLRSELDSPSSPTLTGRELLTGNSDSVTLEDAEFRLKCSHGLLGVLIPGPSYSCELTPKSAAACSSSALAYASMPWSSGNSAQTFLTHLLRRALNGQGVISRRSTDATLTGNSRNLTLADEQSSLHCREEFYSNVYPTPPGVIAPQIQLFRCEFTKLKVLDEDCIARCIEPGHCSCE